MTVMLLGWAVILGAVSAFLPVMVSPFIITRRFVLDEEQQLRVAFGQKARDYFAQSRRW